MKKTSGRGDQRAQHITGYPDRRAFLGGLLLAGTATALGLVLRRQRRTTLSLREAEFYKPHTTAS